MSLSPDQKLAVERTNQDVCVVAGPGSGKTRVLIERFAWLVEFHHVSPTRILAITFTEKAATEIKERLIHRFANSTEQREAIERAWVSTIDGFCSRLLQENAIAAGIAPDFIVLEQTQATRLARESAEESLDELYAERPGEMRRLLEALDLSTDDLGRKPDLAQSLLDIYEAMRISGVDELPQAERSTNLWPEARALASRVLEDRGKSASETEALRDWAARFLALPQNPTRDHFALELKAHTGRVGKSRADDAKALKNEILPALCAQWIEIWNGDLLDLLREAVLRLDLAYRGKKREISALDFADLEQDAIRLLETNYFIREETRARFDQILMDELQDTNRLQWRLLNLIRTPDSFFAVGDINQSIYGFRYADPDVFQEYRRRLEASGATIDDLRENHRSRQTILDAVSRVLDGQPGIETRPLVAAGKFSKVTGPTVERLVGETEEAEASLVAARILELGCEYKDVAILVRSLNALPPFIEALDRFGIPFVTTGGRTFLEAREIRDLRAFLAALVNPLDEVALIGVLRGPIVGLSDEEILRIGKAGWQEFFEARFGHLRKLAGFVSPDRLLPVQADLSSRARANVDKLFSWLRRNASPPFGRDAGRSGVSIGSRSGSAGGWECRAADVDPRGEGTGIQSDFRKRATARHGTELAGSDVFPGAWIRRKMAQSRDRRFAARFGIRGAEAGTKITRRGRDKPVALCRHDAGRRPPVPDLHQDARFAWMAEAGGGNSRSVRPGADAVGVEDGGDGAGSVCRSTAGHESKRFDRRRHRYRHVRGLSAEIFPGQIPGVRATGFGRSDGGIGGT